MEEFKYLIPEESIDAIISNVSRLREIENDLRKWKKVDVKFIERHRNSGLESVNIDEDGDYLFFYEQTN